MNSLRNIATEVDLRKAYHRERLRLRKMEFLSDAEKLSVMVNLDKARDEALDGIRIASLGNEEEILQMSRAQEICPRVFLGPYSIASDIDALRTIGITHILSLSAEGRPCFIEHDIVYLEHAIIEVECNLTDGADILARVLPSSLNFVQRALDEDDAHKVLIHCLHGKTRSAAIASCCRASILNEELNEAYSAIKRKRPVVVPEAWFPRLREAMRQLKNQGKYMS